LLINLFTLSQLFYIICNKKCPVNEDLIPDFKEDTERCFCLDQFSRSIKIIVLQGEELLEHYLNDTIEYCSTKEELTTKLTKNRLSTLIVACNKDMLLEIASLLVSYSIETLYILNDDEEEMMWPVELFTNNFEIIEVHNEKKLMRRLCLKAMLCYYKQGLQYKTDGDNGLANMYFHQSIEALNSAANFI
jgi:hypothetical protein